MSLRLTELKVEYRKSEMVVGLHNKFFLSF